VIDLINILLTNCALTNSTTL